MTVFQERLKKIMEEKNFTQKDLVVKTGLAKSGISRYVSGKMVPSEENLKVIANALKVSEEWLTGTETQHVDISMENMVSIFSKMSDLGKTELIKRSSEMLLKEDYVVPELRI